VLQTHPCKPCSHTTRLHSREESERERERGREGERVILRKIEGLLWTMIPRRRKKRRRKRLAVGLFNGVLANGTGQSDRALHLGVSTFAREGVEVKNNPVTEKK
jgi:hypothetical protein